MNKIASFFLRAKHWQIFLLLFGMFFIGMIIAITGTIWAAPRSPEDFGKFNLLFGCVMGLPTIGFFGWIWSIGSFLSSFVPPPLRLRMSFFRFALIYPVVYVIFVFAFIPSLQNFKPVIIAFIAPFHLLVMFCQIYDLYFVSKSLVMVETGKPALFYDYAGPFFLIWFFPVGIWVVQPRINRIYAEKRPAKAGTPEPEPAEAVTPKPETGRHWTFI